MEFGSSLLIARRRTRNALRDVVKATTAMFWHEQLRDCCVFLMFFEVQLHSFSIVFHWSAHMSPSPNALACMFSKSLIKHGIKMHKGLQSMDSSHMHGTQLFILAERISA